MSRAENRRLLIVLMVGLAARLAALAPGFRASGDIDGYLPLARSIAAGEGFRYPGSGPTAYRPPLYPLILAPLVAIGGAEPGRAIGLLHLALGVATVGLTFGAARRMGRSPDRSTLAALVVAFDPVLLVQVRSIMTETLAAALVALVLILIPSRGRRGLILAGGASGLASLCRPSLLPGAGLVALAIATRGPGPARGRRLADASIYLAAIAATLAPWAIRNARAFGEPVWTTTHGGYTLALANNPAYYADVVDGPPGAVWSGANQAAWFERITRETAGMTQPEADRALRRDAVALARERPRTFLRASLARLGRFWGVAPSGSVYGPSTRLATAAWTIPLWIALGLGLARRDSRRWPVAAAPALILGLTAVHVVYWTDLRMRVPIVPAIAIVAAGAWFPGRDRPGRAAGGRRSVNAMPGG